MIYCMADLHGERDFFLRMLEQIRFSDTDHLYILGDVIDRGTGGIDLLEQIMEAPNMTMLLGNHEQMCLSTLGPHNEYGARELWRQNGGMVTYRQLRYRCSLPQRNRILRFLSVPQDTEGEPVQILVHALVHLCKCIPVTLHNPLLPHQIGSSCIVSIRVEKVLFWCTKGRENFFSRPGSLFYPL